MSGEAKAAAVLYAKDLARVVAFYAGVSELRVQQVAKDHVVLESPHFQLVILQIPDRIAASIEITVPPVRRTETPIKLVFPVSNLAAVRNAAGELGGALNSIEREWIFEGCKVCDGHDPEGNVVQFREVARRG